MKTTTDLIAAATTGKELANIVAHVYWEYDRHHRYIRLSKSAEVYTEFLQEFAKIAAAWDKEKTRNFKSKLFTYLLEDVERFVNSDGFNSFPKVTGMVLKTDYSDPDGFYFSATLTYIEE